MISFNKIIMYDFFYVFGPTFYFFNKLYNDIFYDQSTHYWSKNIIEI